MYYTVPMTWMKGAEKGAQHAVRCRRTESELELQIFNVRVNAFHFIAYLNGNSRVELKELMEADLAGQPYTVESIAAALRKSAAGGT